MVIFGGPQAENARLKRELAAAHKHPAAAPVTGHKMPTKPPSGHVIDHKARAAAAGDAPLTGPQGRIIEALAFWRGIGFEAPSRAQLGAVAGYSPSSGGFNNLLGQLRSLAMIDYPAGGFVTLTDTGLAIAPEPDDAPVRQRLARVLSNPQAKIIIDALPTDGSAMSRDALGPATGYSASSGGNLLGSLRTLGLVTYPSPGQVAAETWVWQ